MGIYDGEMNNLNYDEVNAVKWIDIYQLFLELDLYPERFTYWFKTALLELRNKKLLSAAAIKKLFETS